MQNSATATDVKTAQDKMASAIFRLEKAVQQLKLKDSAMNQIISELDGHISSLEQFIDNSKEK